MQKSMLFLHTASVFQCVNEAVSKVRVAMKKLTRNSVAVLLMLSSIVLLLVLQVFWLRGTYRDAEQDFRKETNTLFRNTILAMHDSLIQRNLKPVAGDSTFGTVRMKRRFSARADDPFSPMPDSNFNSIYINEKTTRIEIYSNSDEGDSVQNMLRPLITKIQKDRKPRHFIFDMEADSLRADSIRFYFRQALDKAGVSMPFKVLGFPGGPAGRIEKKRSQAGDGYTSEIVRLSPGIRYAVSFQEIDRLLLKEIAPQVLFSVFLTLLTVVAFFVMYKNLLAQQRLMEIKNDFISNITHELKTPVATVSVALEALKNFNAFDNPQRSREYLEIARMELDRLTLVTDKILKIAVFENKGVDLKFEQVDLDAIVQQVLSSMKLVFEKRNASISFQKQGTDFTLEGSHIHLTNVLYNLVDNALKYSPDESTIEIALNSTNADKVILSVKDTGIGIPGEYQKKIFEKFFRVPSGDVHNTKGYGLGLSYVSGVAKSHGGEIKVESEPGKGSRFIIILPKKHED
jgi:two-component system phosphate regulon sensor histidine kinase PhoR